MGLLLDTLRIRPRKKKEGQEYADLYSRAMASFIDLMLIFFIFSSLFYYKAALIGALECREAPHPKTWEEFAVVMSQKFFSVTCLLDNVLEVLIIGIAIVSTQITMGTTPGKWLIGLKIVRHGTHAPLAPWRYVLRFFAYIPAMLSLIGILWISFNKQRRGWHDYIAGTVVLNLRPEGWYWNHVKRLYRKLRAVKEPVSEPAAAQSHEDGSKPVD